MKIEKLPIRQIATLIESRKMATVAIELTPEIAQYLLGRNHSNRPLNRLTVEQYVRDMKKGDFVLTGDSIKVSSSGKLIDGQHRCTAVVESKSKFPTILVCGLEEDVFDKIDTGRTRVASDVLHIKGFDNPIRMSAMVKFIINFKRGAYDQAIRNYSKGGTKVTNTMVLAYAEANKTSLTESYYYGYNKDNKIINGTQLAGLHYIFKTLNREDANNFCKNLADGLNLTKDSPIYVLRKKLIDDARAKNKMDIYERVAYVCKAWNLFRKRRKVARFKLDIASGEFPKPI